MPARLWPKIVTFLLVGFWSVEACAAETSTSTKSLQSFLHEYLSQHDLKDETARYSAAPVSLDDRTPMWLVYISGQDWCGSGGCRMLLLKSSAAMFKVLSDFSLARLPIHVLRSLTKGWHDLTVPVAGGGVAYHTVILRYNGSRYPSNPSMAPLLRSLKPAGTELPLEESGERVYR